MQVASYGHMVKAANFLYTPKYTYKPGHFSVNFVLLPRSWVLITVLAYNAAQSVTLA